MKTRRDASPEGTWDDNETFSLQELRKKSRDAVLQAQLLSSGKFLSVTISKAVDEECCSYDKGYTEQLVFACLTCVSEDDKMAGMCIACSLNCHEVCWYMFSTHLLRTMRSSKSSRREPLDAIVAMQNLTVTILRFLLTWKVRNVLSNLLKRISMC